jgi:hypothetical protein
LPATSDKLPTIHLRFAGGPAARRVSGTITIGDPKVNPRTIEVTPVDLEPPRRVGSAVEIAFRTKPETPVGYDIVVDPPNTPVTWELWLDDKPWPDEAFFGGPYGLLAPALRKGLANDEARAVAQAPSLPTIDPHRDVGLFVTRERRGEPEASRETNDEGAEEMARLLREWGYAHGSSATK